MKSHSDNPASFLKCSQLYKLHVAMTTGRFVSTWSALDLQLLRGVACTTQTKPALEHLRQTHRLPNFSKTCRGRRPEDERRTPVRFRDGQSNVLLRPPEASCTASRLEVLNTAGRPQTALAFSGALVVWWAGGGGGGEMGGEGGISGELEAWLTLISERSPGNEAIMRPAICCCRC